jgi:hypothetical protein
MKSKKILQYIKGNFLIIFLAFISLFINIASVIYYFYKINNFILIISVVISIILTFLFVYFTINKDNHQAVAEKKERHKERLKTVHRVFLITITLFLFLYLFYLLFSSASLLPISSPWLFLSWNFFIPLWLLIIFLYLNFYFKTRASYLFLTLLYLLFFSVSFFVYKIAFGYDQLLHQRAIFEILNFGLIEPKTFYYVGQYVLEYLFLSIWPFSSEIVNKAIVPFMAAILIPLSLWFNLKDRSFNEKIWPIIILLTLPFSFFTFTVPQNLSFLFVVILLIFSFNNKFVSNKINFLFLASLAVSSFFIHPLAGIPAILFVCIFFADNINKLDFKIARIKVILNAGKSFAYLSQVLILPILLLISGGIIKSSSMDFSSWTPKLLGQENIILNFVYFIGFNINWFLLLIFIYSGYFIFKKRLKSLYVFYYNSVALMASYILSLFVDFPFLSQIDKGSYAHRILILSFIFLLPIIYELISFYLKKIKKNNLLFRVLVVLFLSFFIMTSLYLNYPRQDNYFNSRSYSVSEHDFEAVRLIKNLASEKSYAVLANQQVGAAAIKEYGFKKYYGPWFYYSVQTGGLLYDYYLKMIENPQADLMNELMRKIGADEIYVVINDYWWAFDRIFEEMKAEADSYYQIGENNLSIFKFRIKKD